MDEDNQPQPPAQNPDEVSEPTSPVEQAQPDEPPAPPEAPEPEPVVEPEKPKPSRAERRITQLNEKLKQQVQGQMPPQQSPRFPQYEDGQQVSPEQLQQDVVQTADAIATARVAQQLAQRDAVNYFERDSERLPTMYNELNPDHEAYTPELDESVAQEYQDRAFKVIGYNQQGEPVTQLDPNVRLSDIAERQIKAARAYAQKTHATMQTAMAKASDEAAIQPTPEPKDERKWEDLSIEEMEQRLGPSVQR